MKAELHRKISWVGGAAMLGSALSSMGCQQHTTASEDARAAELRSENKAALQVTTQELRPASGVTGPEGSHGATPALLEGKSAEKKSAEHSLSEHSLSEQESGEQEPLESEPSSIAAGGTGASEGRPTASGPPSATCVNGWITPARGSRLRKAALDMIRETPEERFGVVEMRYFVGPEDAEVLSPQREVERWYIKAYSTAHHKHRQRWLVRRAPLGAGVDAVAPYDSHGYGAHTWKRVGATNESLADPFLRPCEGSEPGQKCMGLPRQVLGCLAGT
jgi:hypothetical protein